MNEKEKEAVARILKESQITLNAIRKLIEEKSDIPKNIKERAFKELEKAKNKIEKTATKR
ncbi:MAG: hypothetical protein LBR92_02855 [Puniceicoccales bacterium]|jgi:hypothetical protein|nr:hypothetical protein [Puniceicoccales bacterium]